MDRLLFVRLFVYLYIEYCYIKSEQKNERTVVTSQIYYINHVVYL